MKKITTTLIMLLTVTLGFGQIVLMDEQHNIVTNTIIDVDLVSGGSSTEEILVKNAGTLKDTLKALRSIYSVDANDQTQFCFGGLCYAYTTNLSSLTLAVEAGDTVDYEENGFHALFSAGSACVTRSVHYRFYNVNNFSDSAGVTFRYMCATGINEQGDVAATLSNAFPNPANSSVSFKYTMSPSSEKGKIVMNDMLGKCLKEIQLQDKQGTAKVSVLDLEPGIYFYTYIVDDKAISSKKVVITR